MPQTHDHYSNGELLVKIYAFETLQIRQKYLKLLIITQMENCWGQVSQKFGNEIPIVPKNAAWYTRVGKANSYQEERKLPR